MFKNLFKKSSEQEKLEIYAPLNGKVVKLEDAPDPVFNQKMMGEGIAIMPSEGKVVSPVEGKIVQVPESKHADGIEATDGTEILIQVGHETVAVQCGGSTVNVAAGDKRSVGTPVMKFNI